MEVLQIIGGIILLLLKIIGIALLIVLLILLLLLFVPIGWKIKAAHAPGTPLASSQAKFNVSVWGGIIRMTVAYDMKASLRLRIIGLTVWHQSLLNQEQEEAAKDGQGETDENRAGETSTLSKQDRAAETESLDETKPEIVANVDPETEMDSKTKTAPEVEGMEVTKSSSKQEKQSKSGKKRLSFGNWMGRGCARLFRPLRHLYEKLRALFGRVREIAGAMMHKTELGMAYWEWFRSRPVQAMLKELLLMLRKLLWHIRPRKGRGWLVFGVGDPMHTALLYGLTTEWWTMKRMHVDAEPSLEEKKVDGELSLYGRLVPAYIGWLGLKLVLKKELRKSLATRPRSGSGIEQNSDATAVDREPDETIHKTVNEELKKL